MYPSHGNAQEGTIVTVRFSPGNGWELDTWSVSGGGAAKVDDTSFRMGSGEATVSATYRRVSHSITVSVTPSGSGTVSVPSSAQEESVVDVSFVPSEGWRVGSWSVSGGGAAKIDGNSFRMGNDDAAVSVTFEQIPQEHSISASVSPADSGCTVSAPAKAQENETVSVSFAPADGWRLDSWSVSGGGATKIDNSSFRMGDDDAEISAVFERVYRVSVSSLNDAAVSPSRTVPAGTSVTIRGTVPENCAMVGVNAVDSNGNTVSCSYSLSDDGRNATITFTMPEANVTVDVILVS